MSLGAASANVSVELNKDADTLAVIYKHTRSGKRGCREERYPDQSEATVWQRIPSLPLV